MLKIFRNLTRPNMLIHILFICRHFDGDVPATPHIHVPMGDLFICPSFPKDPCSSSSAPRCLAPSAAWWAPSAASALKCPSCWWQKWTCPSDFSSIGAFSRPTLPAPPPIAAAAADPSGPSLGQVQGSTTMTRPKLRSARPVLQRHPRNRQRCSQPGKQMERGFCSRGFSGACVLIYYDCFAVNVGTDIHACFNLDKNNCASQEKFGNVS